VTRSLKATTLAIGVFGAFVIGFAMLLGPLLADPGPGAAERFVIFAYPICMLLGGVFVLLRTRIALLYAGLAAAFAVGFVAIHLSGPHGWDTFNEKVVYSLIIVGPGLILSSLCWSVMRLESDPALPTRLG